MLNESAVAEFVTKVAYPFSKPHLVNNTVPSGSLLEAVRFAGKNKIFPLFYQGCRKLHIQLPDEAEKRHAEYEKRRAAHNETIEYLVEASARTGIDLIFIKTFKPFDYVPDDIDLLLRNTDDLKGLQGLLKSKGFQLLKIGTPEVTMRRIYPGTYVDIDIHTSLAVGHLVLFDLEKVWRTRTYRTLETGLEVPVLPEYFEMVRESAYSLLKDFKISIPALYSAIHMFLTSEVQKGWKLAEEEGFCFHVYLFLEATRILAGRLFGLSGRQREVGDGLLVKQASRLVVADLNKSCRVPYAYPMLVIALAYFARVVSETQRRGNLEAWLQLIKQPSSKGIDILTDYVKGRPSMI